MRWSSNPLSMASGGTLTSAIDLGFGPTAMNIAIGSVSSTTVYVLSAEKDSGTYRRIYMMGTGSTSGTQFQHATTLSNAVAAIPAGHRFIKIETQAAVSDGTTFHILYSY